MVNGKFGFAVIGYGGMGGWHINQMLEKFSDRAEVLGIYDISPDAAERARKKGIHAYSSREELLADERIDLVTIATPNDVHKEIAIDALNAGKNVISEKPVTLSVPDYEEMVAAAKKNNRLFTTHQNRRWDEDYLIVRKLIDDNTLGRVFRIEHRVQGSRGVPGDWRNQKEHGGGMVLDWGIHLLDQVLQMTYPHKLVSVYNELTYITNENCDDGFRATLVFDDGLSFYVEVTTSNFIELPLWYVLGENGSAVINNWNYDGEIVKVSDWENRDAKLLSVISINGFIIALTRQLSINGVQEFEFYDDLFQGWSFDFSKGGFPYTSSQYRRFSTEILRQVFKIPEEFIDTL